MLALGSRVELRAKREQLPVGLGLADEVRAQPTVQGLVEVVIIELDEIALHELRMRGARGEQAALETRSRFEHLVGKRARLPARPRGETRLELRRKIEPI